MNFILVLSCCILGAVATPWPPQGWPRQGWPPHSQHWSYSPPPYPTASSLSPTATIGIGTVIGTTTTLPTATAAVNKFLGIPFAKSPPERFSPPVPPAALERPLDAKVWKPACIQQFTGTPAEANFTKGIFNEPPPEESEDCLYLNVYAPSTPPPPGGRTVMFWIYGGHYEFGTAGLPVYDGSAFAAYQDVILVSSNYRTNVFGFPNAPEIAPTKQNLAYLDQHLALEWVQQNIHAFGGDPEKVTIFGQSAGADAVDVLLTSPAYLGPGKRAPFRGAILESGQQSYHGLPPSSNSTQSWLSLAKALGCTSTSTSLSCVRAAAAQDIKKIIEDPTMNLAFNPVPDNYTLAASPAAARAAGNFTKVPVLGGTNADEGRVYLYGRHVNVTAVAESAIGPVDPKIIPAVLKEFPAGHIKGYNTQFDVASELYGLLDIQCGVSLWANETAAQLVPTWRYYYNASFPNYSPLGGKLGVFHTSEIPQVFQTYPGGPVNPVTPQPEGFLPTNLPPTAQQEKLSKFMNSAWARFAKNPSDGPGWTALGTFGRKDMAELGADGSTGLKLIKRQGVDAPCQVLLPQFEALTGKVFGL